MDAAEHASGKSIAVIGSGLAGLSCAWLLAENGCKVDIFEKQGILGLGAHSVKAGDDIIDVPARVFVESFYGEMLALYHHIGVETCRASLEPTLQCVSSGRNFMMRNWSFFGRFHIPIVPLKVFFAGPRVTFNIIRDIFRFKFSMWRIFKSKNARKTVERLSLGEFAERENYSEDFTNLFLIPIFTVVGTCSWESVKNYPAIVAMEYMNNLILTGNTFFKLRRGTQHAAYVLTQNVRDVHTNTPVHCVRKTASGRYQVIGSGAAVQGELYDHVVFATQANQVMSLLSEEAPPYMLTKVLASFTHEKTKCVVHRDQSAGMPAQRSLWSTTNIITNKEKEVMCTVWQNRFQRLSSSSQHENNNNNHGKSSSTAVNIFQTINPLLEIPQHFVLGVAHFERPVVTMTTATNIQKLNKLQGTDNLWFVGAYSMEGVPLLENACDSGLLAAEKILAGVLRPWRQRSSAGDHRRSVGGQRQTSAAAILIFSVTAFLCCWFSCLFN